MEDRGTNIADFRWIRTLHDPDRLGEDLGSIGASVGPRKGPNKRTQGEKEDYVLRRLLAAWRLTGQLRFPVDVRAERDRAYWPDFVLVWPDAETLGIEVTEAGDKQYQRWLTETDDRNHQRDAIDVPFEPSTPDTVNDLVNAVRAKVHKYDRGSYRGPARRHLVVYDNTSWGAFLDKRELVEGVRSHGDLTGRFDQVHLVFGEAVVVDVFGAMTSIDVSRSYEIDYPRWISVQVQNLHESSAANIDAKNIAEELADLGKTERRALSSHTRNLLVHLLKFQFQRKRRSESWTDSISNARAEIEEILTESPSLRSEFIGRFDQQYAKARRQAAIETKLSEKAFPEKCPYSPEQLLDDGYLPGEE